MSTGELIIKPIETALDVLRKRAEAIEVRNQEQYVVACQIALDGRAYIKDVKYKLGPGIESAKQHLDFLRNEQARYIEPANLIVETVAKKAEAWKAEERRKAEAEQRRINEENMRQAALAAEQARQAALKKAEQERKEAEAHIKGAQEWGLSEKDAAQKAALAKLREEEAHKQAELEAIRALQNVEKVTVAAAVPKVVGIKARVNWKFRVVDESKLPRPYLKPNEVAIGEMVRGLKNKEQAEAKIPGIEVWSEDGI